MNIESLANEIRARHKLTNLHLFTVGTDWTVFGFRKDPKGYSASVEKGSGPDIGAALRNLDTRLIEGPIHKAAPPWSTP